VLVNTTFENAAEQIVDVAKRFSTVVEQAGIPCRVIGGLAVFVHIDQVDPIAARLTRDVDVSFDRKDLDAVRSAVEEHGFTYRHVAGVDTFLMGASPKARSGVHVVFAGEKVRPNDPEPVPSSEPVRCGKGFLVAPVSDLVRMKLTSFRLKDKVHIQDLDGVGLITPEIEASLSEPLRGRLADVRATR
jgi:hypothetical protein